MPPVAVHGNNVGQRDKSLLSLQTFGSLASIKQANHFHGLHFGKFFSSQIHTGAAVQYWTSRHDDELENANYS
jgi:hypothetical protein